MDDDAYIKYFINVQIFKKITYNLSKSFSRIVEEEKQQQYILRVKK